jgi:hypothetical protein
MVGDMEQIKCLLATDAKGLELLDWNYLILNYIGISLDIITKTLVVRPLLSSFMRRPLCLLSPHDRHFARPSASPAQLTRATFLHLRH